MKRIVIIPLCLLILAGAMLACGESSNNTGTVTNTSSSSTAPTAATNKHFKIGDVVTVGSTWHVTVDSVKTSNGSDLYKPKSGMVYLLITVSMKNISSSEQDVSSLISFNLADKDGQKYNETIDPDAGSTPDGKVEAGSPLKGVLAYEVPSSMKTFTLSFQSDITSSGETVWDITA